jgi:hypothetical protein
MENANAGYDSEIFSTRENKKPRSGERGRCGAAASCFSYNFSPFGTIGIERRRWPVA